MQIGYIYKITNMVNGKCYIGQTSKSYKKRWDEHKATANTKSSNGYNYPLYRAIRKYGIKKFSFKVIEKCDINKLNEREIYWIQFYDSYRHGYNQDMGGGGKHTLVLDENAVIQKYKELRTVAAVAKHFNCSHSSIKEILIKHNIKIIQSAEHAKEKAFLVKQIDVDGNIIHIYPSLMEAGRAMFAAGVTDTKDEYNAAHAIRYGIIKHHKVYGYWWDSPNYSAAQREKICEELSNIKKVYYKNTQNSRTKICPMCGATMASESKHCLTCAKKIRHDRGIDDLKSRGITREFLKSKIRTTPFTVIARSFNVTDVAVRKWCQKYNLPFKKTLIHQYTDDEWEKI